MIFLKDEDFIAKGNERACYYHPNDKTKTIKITFENNNRKDSKQSEKEIKYYKQLKNKGLNNWQHLPKYFGEVQTNKGNGFIIELIKDYDGKISKSFAYYLKKYDLKKYEKQVEIYKQYFLKYCIIFNYGMMPKNILLRKLSKKESELVLIDGLGDVSHFTILNGIPAFARRRINRRWDKFVKKYL